MSKSFKLSKAESVIQLHQNHEPPQTLEECEEAIERGQKSFIEVGQALLVIRDGLLYKKQGYASFELYCEQRWGFKRSWADKQISSAEAVLALKSADDRPQSEAQARPLARLREQPELLRQAWETATAKAKKSSGPTESQVREAVRTVLGEPVRGPGSKPKLDDAEQRLEAVMADLYWFRDNQRWDMLDRVKTWISRQRR